MTNQRPAVIAIDGPGASGKSTVGRLVAEKLGYRFIDTGGMYRAITWLALQGELDLDDEASLVTMAETTPLAVLPGGRFFVGDQDLTPLLHLPEVDAKV